MTTMLGRFAWARACLVDVSGRDPGAEHTRRLLEAAPDATIVIDAAGRIGASLPPNRRAVFRLPAEVGDAWDVSVQGDGGATAVLERGRLRVQAGPLAAHVQAVQLTRR